MAVNKSQRSFCLSPALLGATDVQVTPGFLHTRLFYFIYFIIFLNWALRIGIQVLACACTASALIPSFLVKTSECWSPRLLRAIRNCTGCPWKSLQLGRPSEWVVGRSCRGRQERGLKKRDYAQEMKQERDTPLALRGSPSGWD